VLNVWLRGLLVAVALLVTGGCGGAPKTAPSPTPTPAAECIRDAEERAGGLHLPLADGHRLDGVVLGSGDTGVVFANQSNGDLCTWKSVYGDYLGGQGYRVLLFNYSGGDPGKDVLAGVEALRARGVRKVFLIGASMGGTAVLYAAAHAQPAVAGVVDLSGPRVYSGVDASAAVTTMTVPAVFIAAAADSPFAKDTQDMYAACTSTDKKLDVEPGGEHGWGLVNDKVSAMIEQFLKAH
jgi:dienelactone hydrolase family protein